MSDPLTALFDSIQPLLQLEPGLSRTAKLLRGGTTKVAKKLAEEAVEVGLEAVQGNRSAVVLESADLLYNLCVLWTACGVTPREVFEEIERRERVFGIAEKLPKGGHAEAQLRRMGVTQVKL